MEPLLKTDAKIISKIMNKSEKLIKKGKKYYGIKTMTNTEFKAAIDLFAQQNKLKVKYSIIETHKGNKPKAVFNTDYNNCNEMQEKASKIFWQIASVSGKMQIINL